MVNLISSKKLGVYKVMRNTVPVTDDHFPDISGLPRKYIVWHAKNYILSFSGMF